VNNHHGSRLPPGEKSRVSLESLRDPRNLVTSARARQVNARTAAPVCPHTESQYCSDCRDSDRRYNPVSYTDPSGFVCVNRDANGYDTAVPCDSSGPTPADTQPGFTIVNLPDGTQQVEVNGSKPSTPSPSGLPVGSLTWGSSGSSSVGGGTVSGKHAAFFSPA
jgi:hypothetical protein